MASKHGGGPVGQVVADNRKARFNFEILETLEAGIQLTGSEVKSLRNGRASLGEAYATVENSGELYLVNAHIPEYFAATRENHPPKRPRKLLMHRREIDRLAGAISREGLTVVPLKLYFNDRGIAKLQIALAKGKKVHDKRQTERDRDWARDKARLMREKG
jgi:SsrA-binding protein